MLSGYILFSMLTSTEVSPGLLFIRYVTRTSVHAFYSLTFTHTSLSLTL